MLKAFEFQNHFSEAKETNALYMNDLCYNTWTEKKKLSDKKIPAVAFNNFSHVSIIGRDKNITFQRNKIIQCCHLRWVILEVPKVWWFQQCFLSDLFQKPKEPVNRCWQTTISGVNSWFQLSSTNQFWISWRKTWHSPFTPVYFTSCNINLDIRINVQCPQSESCFLRSQRTQPIFPLQVRIYYFFFPPRISISVHMRKWEYVDQGSNKYFRLLEAKELIKNYA